MQSYDRAAGPDPRQDLGTRLERLADEQAALRRVAMLVARSVGSAELFQAVSVEVAELFDSVACVGRFEPDGSAMILVGLSEDIGGLMAGSRLELDGFLASTQVHRTGRPARSPHSRWRNASGAIADTLRESGLVASTSAPIVVEGKPWGVIAIAVTGAAIPVDAEERLEKFTELVATAIANAESRTALRELAEVQAALGRVATLVARGASPGQLFAAVSDEVGALFGAEAGVARFEPDGSGLVFAGLSRGIEGIAVGTRWPLEDFLACTEVHRTGRPARAERGAWEDASGPAAEALRKNDPVSMVAAPIVVERSLWGVITVADMNSSLPPHVEERLEKFTDLLGTAIANANSRAELASSEARAHDLAREHAALRRVATLVAEGASAHELFAAVAREVSEVLGIPVVGLHRFEADRTFTMMGIAGQTNFTVGSRWPVEEEGLAGMILAAGHPARKDDYTTMSGPLGAAMRDDTMISTVGVPIGVEGAIWGFMVGAARPGMPIPDGIEERLARFTELVATAIANSQARAHLAQLADEQAALRRVATLVARRVSPDVIFSAVAEEIARLFDCPQTTVARLALDGSEQVVVGVSQEIRGVSIGTRFELDDSTAVSTLAAPILVEGRLWGVVNVTDTRAPLPADAEERLGKFTALIGTAIANADSRAELAASRARVIAAADDARRRIERDLHDGAQQRLVTLAVALRRAEAKIPPGSEELRADITRIVDGLTTAAEELREMSRGIHPAVLTEGGLGPALKALGRRSAVRVKLDVGFAIRLPDRVEVAAYYTVSEALTNAAKYADATGVWVSLRVEDDTLTLSVRDDGVGGADPTRGSGLTGLNDRIEALGGKLEIESAPGEGTQIHVEIPTGVPR
jgi:signal transduction histidine kinase